MYRVLAESIVSDAGKPVTIASQKIIQDSCEKFLNGQSKDIIDQNIIRSECDKFDYRVIQLENGIKIILISDPSYKQLSPSSQETISSSESDDDSDDNNYFEKESENDSEMPSSRTSNKSRSSSISSCGSSRGSAKKTINKKTSAIAVGVKVGSMQDPKEVQGMAHMLEHLLFMGSKKYPEPNAIDEFLSSRDGYMNACTDIEHTLYEVRVDKKYLQKTIDMVGHAFVSPLLNHTIIYKEIEPIDSEYVQASNDDDVRIEMLFSHLSEPNHPTNKFFWGNRKSLIDDPKANNIDVQKALREFHQKYYKPQNIVVAVQSQESLENLTEWTSQVFSQVESKSVENDELNGYDDYYKNIPLPFTEHRDLFHRLYYIKSINHGTRLLVHWCLPPVLNQYLQAPLDYWASIVGYEGKGSLISVLRGKDLAIDLYTHSDILCFYNNHLFCLFEIDIHLTENGSKNLNSVVDLLLEFLRTIQNAGAQKSYFHEKQVIAMNSFNKKSEKNSLEYTKNLTKNMLFFPLEHFLTGNSLYYHFDKQCIDSFGNQLRPDNANFMVLGPKLLNNLKTNIEPWMNVQYQSIDIPENWVNSSSSWFHNQKQSEYFHYPETNKFIATNFDLLCDTLPKNCQERKNSQFPVKIIDENLIIVWHKTDFEYRLPKAAINIHILSPFAENSLKNFVMFTILQEYLTLILKVDTYDAYEACLNWELERSYYGLTLKAFGFNEKLSQLVFIILERLLNVEFSKELLYSVKKDIIQNYSDCNQDPETLCKDLFTKSLVEKHFSHIELIPETEKVTEKDMIAYKEKLLSNISFEILIQGNINIKQTIEFSKQLKTMFKIDSKLTKDPPVDKIKHRVAKLPSKDEKIRILTLIDTNQVSMVECYQQIGPIKLKSDCYVKLFIDIINEHCFHVLRTCEGLGYSVGCTNQTMFGILGLSVYVECDAKKFDCSFIQDRIKNFIQINCNEYIFQTLTKEKFQEFVQSLIARNLKPNINLESEVKKNWQEIIVYDYCFNRRAILVNELKKANLEDFRKWVQENIFKKWEEPQLFSVQIVGNGKPALDECLTIDSEEPVNENCICNDKKEQKLQYLKSKNQMQQNFIKNIEEFRKNLCYYPPQPSYKNCV